MIATTIEQSKRLFELGLSPDSADMEYCYIDEFNSGLQVKGDINAEVDRRLDMMFGVTHIPAWSLSALLEVMPKSFKRWCLISNMKDYYWCTFEQNDGFIIKEFYAENPITAAYQMVCWLLEQGFIKKRGNNE